ncbi:MAG TPA: hypothetical protein VIP11_03600 [Gemmatimonadaceae bacterium]
MPYRTEIQVALLIVGMIVWGYGQRSENKALQYTGLGFFAAATALRFVKKQPPNDGAPPSP